MAGNSKRENIRMNSTAGTGYFKTTTRNKRNNTPKNPNMQNGSKLTKSMYDPTPGVQKHVPFVEGKIK